MRFPRVRKMKKNELMSYISDFLSLLYFREGLLDKIESIILFGSVARGNFDNESDIDLFISLKDEKDAGKMQEIVDNALNEFEYKAKEVWHVGGIKNPIKCIVAALGNKQWELVKKEMQSYGILLYGACKSESGGLTSYSLFEYSLRRFSQKNRVAFQRGLVGYNSKKNGKIYEHKGLIKKLNGANLENNSIIVPTKEAFGLQRFFSKRKVTPKIREVMIKEKFW